MKGLTITVPTTRKIPVEILSFRWFGAASERTSHLKCTLCKKPVGSEKQFGGAFIRYGKKERSVRLCNECGVVAEKESEGKPNLWGKD